MIEQIEFADVILLNKMDLVSPKEADEVKHALRTMNKNAEIIETTKSMVPLNKILNTGKFDFE